MNNINSFPETLQSFWHEFGSLNYMNPSEVMNLCELFSTRNISRVLELGFYKGKSSLVFSLLMDERGQVDTYDLPSALDLTPNIFDLKNIFDLQDKVKVCISDRSFTWELAKRIASGEKNEYDMIYIDGGHTLDTTATVFLLANTLLKQGGVLIFDDLNWTISKSPHYISQIEKGREIYKEYSSEEKKFPAIKFIAEEIVPSLGYKEISRVNEKWVVFEKQ